MAQKCGLTGAQQTGGYQSSETAVVLVYRSFEEGIMGRLFQHLSCGIAFLLSVVLFFASMSFAQTESIKPLRVGIIGLDTSHVVVFTRIFNDPTAPEHIPGIPPSRGEVRMLKTAGLVSMGSQQNCETSGTSKLLKTFRRCVEWSMRFYSKAWMAGPT